MANQLTIKDELTEFLLYTTPNGKVKVEIFFHDENIWLTQKRMAELFGVQRPAITRHLKNIFVSGELDENSVCSFLEHTAEDGKTDSEAANKKLQNLNSGDIRQAYRKDWKPYYTFDLLNPADYSGWFDRLKKGVI